MDKLEQIMTKLDQMTKDIRRLRVQQNTFQERLTRLEGMAHPKVETVDPTSLDDALSSVCDRLEVLEEIAFHG